MSNVIDWMIEGAVFYVHAVLWSVGFLGMAAASFALFILFCWVRDKLS